MIKYRSSAEGRGQYGILRAVGLVLLVAAVLLGLWVGFDSKKGGSANQKGASSAARRNVAKSGKGKRRRSWGQAEPVLMKQGSAPVRDSLSSFGRSRWHQRRCLRFWRVGSRQWTSECTRSRECVGFHFPRRNANQCWHF